MFSGADRLDDDLPLDLLTRSRVRSGIIKVFLLYVIQESLRCWARGMLFALMFSLLFRLENLQVVVNGAWGDDGGNWSQRKICDCFYIHIPHDWMSNLSKRENCINTAQRYHHYNQHFLLPFALKSDQMCSCSCRMWIEPNHSSVEQLQTRTQPLCGIVAFSQLKGFAEWLKAEK